MNESDVYIVIPAYQEGAVIYTVVHDTIKSGFPKVIVVDDGSKDSTGEEAERAGAYVIRHRLNRGKGAAIKTGLEAAKVHGARIVVTMDGDGQHNPENIPKLIEPIIQHTADAVLGVRLNRPSGMPRLRWLQTRVGNGLTWMLSGLWVHDSQSGFRAYSRTALDSLKTQSSTYDYESEIIQLIAQHSLKYQEVPIDVLYTTHSLTKPDRQNMLNGVKTASRLLWRVLS